MSVLALGLMLVLLAASVSMASLSHTTHLESRAQARNLAEAAIGQAIGEVFARDDFGLAGETVTVTGATGTGVLTFSPGEGARRQLCYSTNNLAQNGSRPGACRAVPQHMLHLVGRGEVNGVREEVECLVARPPFPKGVAAKGRVKADGLLLAGLRDATQASELSPANLFSNEAVDLSGGSHIYGNVGAVGQVTSTADVQVDGEVRSGAAPQEVPTLDLDRLIAAVQSSPVLQTVGSTLPAGKLQYFNYAPGTVTVPGNLELDGAVLAVNGDLIIQGRLEGRGAVFVTGKTEVKAGTNLRSQDQMALVSRGDVKLTGEGRESYFFSGLLYTEGDIEASNLTLYGTIVADGVTLTNVRFYQTDVSVGLRVFKPMEFRSGDYGLLYVVMSVGPDGQPRYSARAYYKQGGSRPPWDYSYAQDDMTKAELQRFIVTWGDSDHGESDDLLNTDLFTYVFNVLSAPPASNPSALDIDLNNILSPGERTRMVLSRSHQSL